MNQYGDTIAMSVAVGFVLGVVFTGVMILLFGRDHA